MDKATFSLVAALMGISALFLPDNAFRRPDPAVNPDEIARVSEASDSARASLTAYADLSHGRILTTGVTPLSVRLRLAAPKREQGERPPMDLVIIVDRSGSMETDNRMRFAKQGLLEAMRQLRPGDRAAIVSFASDVRVDRGLLSAGEDNSTEKIVNAMRPDGGTHLSGGIFEARRILQESARPGRVKQILVLSDGHANEGLLGDELSRLGEEIGQSGIIITALGVGTDYDASTFIKLADSSGGGYAWVTMAERIPAAIRGELARAEAQMIENMRIILRPQPGVRIVNAYKHTIRRTSDGTEVLVPTLSSGEVRSIIIDLEADPDPDQEVRPIIVADIRYNRIGDVEPSAETLRLAVGARGTRDQRIAELSINPEVIAERESLRADLAWAASSHDVAKGNYDVAARNLRQQAEELARKNERLKSPSVAAQIGSLLSAAGRIERRTFFGGSAVSEATMGMNQAALSAGVY